MPTLKGYECRIEGYDEPGHVIALTASKARAQYWRDMLDCCPDLTLMEISVRRAPGYDVTFPDMPDAHADLTPRECEIILHTFGGGSHIPPDQWGFRNHYCCAPDEPILNGLVARGLMTGPHGLEPDGGTGILCGAFFYLTDDGKRVARALIGAREAA